MKNVIILLSLLTTISSCGPEQTTKDKEDALINENISSEKARCASVAGRYVGVWTLKSGERKPAELILVQTDVPQHNPERNQDTIVPTLQGKFSICVNGQSCSDPQKAKFIVVGQINSAQCGSAGDLSLFYDTSHGAPLPVNILAMQIDAKVNGTHLDGYIKTNTDPFFGTITVDRQD